MSASRRPPPAPLQTKEDTTTVSTTSVLGGPTTTSTTKTTTADLVFQNEVVERLILYRTYARFETSEDIAEESAADERGRRATSMPPGDSPGQTTPTDSRNASSLPKPHQGSTSSSIRSSLSFLSFLSPSAPAAKPLPILSDDYIRRSPSPGPGEPGSLPVPADIQPPSSALLSTSPHDMVGHYMDQAQREQSVPPETPSTPGANGPTSPLRQPEHYILKAKGWSFSTKAQGKRRMLLNFVKSVFSPSNSDDSAHNMFDERAGMFLATNRKGDMVKVSVWGFAKHGTYATRHKDFGQLVLGGGGGADVVRSSLDTTSSGTMAETGDGNFEMGPMTMSFHSAASSSSTSSTGATTQQTASIHSQLCQVATTGNGGQFSCVIKIPVSTFEKWKEDHDPLVYSHSTLIVSAHRLDQPNVKTWTTCDIITSTGLSIISDVDDTVKESDVHLGTRAALSNAMFTQPKEVAGSPDVYRYFAAKSIPFHYVSASPHQLYPMIENFLDSFDFPLGSIHLRQLVDNGAGSTQFSTKAYKLKVLRTMMREFPGRQFVLIGDSGERDMEIYAALYREFPKQVVKIFIRDVTTISKLKALTSNVADVGSSFVGHHNMADGSQVDVVKTTTAKVVPTTDDPDTVAIATSSTTEVKDAVSAIPKSVNRSSSFASTSVASAPKATEEDVLKLLTKANKAFSGLPSSLWAIFRHPETMMTDAEVKQLLVKQTMVDFVTPAMSAVSLQ